MRAFVSIVVAALSLAGSLIGPAMAERRLALVIGNDKYEQLPSLQKAVNDSGAMQTALTRLGFTVTRATNASRRTMNERIEAFAGQVQRGDTALFFFAGHGVEIKGINYLLPIDTPEAREGQEGLIGREAVAADSIIERLQERGARVTMMVLDACRDNPFKKAGTRGVGGTRGLAQMTPAEGVFVLFSAGLGQTALDRLSDGDSHPNSVFTRTFIHQLDRPGLTVLDIAKTTQTEVRKLALTVDHRQQPAFYDQIDGVLVLNPAGGVATSPAPAPAAPPKQQPPVVAAVQPSAPAAERAQPPAAGSVAKVFTSRSAAVGAGAGNVQGSFPSKPVTLIVPFAAGGTMDFTARAIVQPMSAALGQPINIENVTGSGGAAGMTQVRNAAPDGHVLVLGGVTSLISSLSQQEKSYDPIGDFAGVGLVASAPFVILGKKDLPAEDLRGFLAYLKSRDGGATYGSGGAGTSTHLACHQFNSLADTLSTHVPYRGMADAIAELNKGSVDYLCAEISTVRSQIRSGAVKALGIASAERLESNSTVQTAAEGGVPGFVASSWYALLAPKGTPKAVIDKLSYALGRALDDSATRRKLMASVGELPLAAQRSPQAVEPFLRAESAKWTPVIKAAGTN